MGRLPSSATAQTLVAFVVVFGLQTVVGFAGVGIEAFALAMPVTAPPWTLVTSVYAHAGPAHLLVNAVVLAILGTAVEAGTTRLRFHAYFVTTGAIAGLAQVLVGALAGVSVAVLGASGAIFALLGYLVTGNPATGWLLAVLDPRPAVALAAAVGLAALLTIATGSPGAALVAHFTGFLCGLAAGRLGLLRPAGRRTGRETQATNESRR